MFPEKAYEYLERVTPLKYDCGKMCGKACCNGEGEIWLLPDEEELFKDRDGFEIKALNGEYNLKCNAPCDENRAIRPFCCRIFPYFPIVSREKEKLHVRLIIDPRGISFCPLSRGEKRCEKSFERAVRKAVRLLCQEERYFKFFSEQGATLEEILSFGEKMLKE